MGSEKLKCIGRERRDPIVEPMVTSLQNALHNIGGEDFGQQVRRNQILGR